MLVEDRTKILKKMCPLNLVSFRFHLQLRVYLGLISFSKITERCPTRQYYKRSL